MNTLVENGDDDAGGTTPHAGGAPRADSSVAPPSLPPPSGTRQVSGELAGAEPTLFDVVVPADNLTLVEVAPQSGQTLILPPGALPDHSSSVTSSSRSSPSSSGSRNAASARTVVVATAPTRGARLLAVFGLARPERMRIWGPVLACFISLGATAIPLWRRAPRSETERPVSATVVAEPAPHPVGGDGDDSDARGANTGPAAEAASSPGAQAAPATERRRHPTGRISARRNKAHGPVMRTRNGAPVVD